jgi:drug/metabolite transporter (DMT)-like permease
MGVVFVLLSAICFGISNAYWKKAIVQKTFYVVIFFRGLFTSALFGVILVFNYFFNFLPNILISSQIVQISDYVYAVLLSIFSGIGLYFFVKSLESEKISIVVPLSSINVFSVLTAVFILHETWKNEYIVQIGFVIFGALLIYLSSKGDYKINNNENILLTSILASFFWGISYALFKVSIQKIGALPFAFILELTITIFAFCLILYNQVFYEILNGNKIKHYIVLSLLLFFGTLFINIGLQYTPIIVVNILSNITLMVSLLLGYILYNEKLNFKEWIGISLILIAILSAAFL